MKQLGGFRKFLILTIFILFSTVLFADRFSKYVEDQRNRDKAAVEIAKNKIERIRKELIKKNKKYGCARKYLLLMSGMGGRFLISVMMKR